MIKRIFWFILTVAANTLLVINLGLDPEPKLPFLIRAGFLCSFATLGIVVVMYLLTDPDTEGDMHLPSVSGAKHYTPSPTEGELLDLSELMAELREEVTQERVHFNNEGILRKVLLPKPFSLRWPIDIFS